MGAKRLRSAAEGGFRSVGALEVRILATSRYFVIPLLAAGRSRKLRVGMAMRGREAAVESGWAY